MTRFTWILIIGALCASLPNLASATEIYSQGECIVILNPGYTIDEVNATWGSTTLDEFPEAGLYLLYVEGVDDMELWALDLETDPAVREAEANYYQDTPEAVRQMVIVAVGGGYVDYEDQLITQRIGLDQAHLQSLGHGTTVGVLDSGVDPNHIALQGHLAPDGYDFVAADAEPWEEANGIDDDGDGTIDGGYGHGTMVAGIIALVAPQAKILPIRILDDEGRGDAWNISKAIHYAVQHGADVLNMSFGVPRSVSMIGHQIDFADSLGVVSVAGAGNENQSDPVYYPGAHSKVMMITAVDSLDIKADFADWNSKVFVSAPGTGVRSAYPGGEWALGAGCSFATPFVTGEVALILGLDPEMTNEALQNRVEAAVDPIDDLPGNEPYQGKLGSGRLFIPPALDGLVSSVPPPLSTPRMLFAYPNPARMAVHFRLPTSGDRAEIFLYDAQGRQVRSLSSSRGEVIWDGSNNAGRRVAPGIYYAVCDAGPHPYRVAVNLVR